MSNLERGFHHFHKRTKRKDEKKHSFKEFYDKFVYFLAIATPLTNLPQILKIYLSQDATGVSVVSWSMFTLISVFWLIYGIIHRDWPIIILNGSLIFFQGTIVIGGLIYG